jgi:hypothetical protein
MTLTFDGSVAKPPRDRVRQLIGSTPILQRFASHVVLARTRRRWVVRAAFGHGVDLRPFVKAVLLRAGERVFA